MSEQKFIHLHNHSEFSALDGLSRAEQMMEVAKADGQPAIALTDHGNVAGAPEFYYTARKHGVLPVLGQEFYIVPDASNKDKTSDEFHTNRHLLAMALNEDGWHSLVELSSIANDRSRYFFKPRIDWAVLREYAGVRNSTGQLSGRNIFDNIAVTSGCLSSEIARGLEESEEEATRILKMYRRLFPHFYLELQKHPILKKYRKDQSNAQAREEVDFENKEAKLNRFLIRYHQKHGVPLLITNDSHYTTADKAEVHDFLLAVQTKTDYASEDRFKFNGTGYHIKTTEEMRTLWRTQPDVWRASQASQKGILGQLKGFKVSEFDSTVWHFPDIPGQTTDPVRMARTIRKRCEQRLRDLGLSHKQRYIRRLDHELGVIREANFEKVFIIVDDYVNWARDHGILVGPGRGSMVAVLVSYLLGITNIDPIKYRLLFERAINPARPSIPDFDIDFDSERIEEVIDYVRGKYGAENVTLIGSHMTMGPRDTVSSVLRTLQVPFQLSKEITAGLPDSVDIINNKTAKDLTSIYESYMTPQLEALMEEHEIMRPATIELQGLVKSFGTHAAGVVISDARRSLTKEIPMMLIPSSGTYTSQYDMDAIKHLHLNKFDFLSITTLNTIAVALAYIGRDVLAEMNRTQVFDDPEVYKMMASGDLTSIFQFQGGAAKQCIMQMGVDVFEDLVAVNALARPGSINFLPAYVAGKRDPSGITYPCKQVRPILRYTNGVIIYQEQVMEIVKVLAGWDDLGADKIKEAIKSKSGTVFNELKPEFIDGCKKNGISGQAAETIWSNIDDYRSYGFNRAHAVAYSVVGYQTAFLKRHYPKEWYTAVLRTSSNKNFGDVIAAIRRLGVPMLLPDVNSSEQSFTLEDGGIRFGLSSIRGIGEAAAEYILGDREANGQYRSVEQFRERMSVYRAVNNKARYEALAESGAFSSIGGTEPSTQQELLMLGTYVHHYPLDKYRKSFTKMIESTNNLRRLAVPSEDLQKVVWGGLVTLIKEIKTKRGEAMAFLKVEYYGEAWDITMFPLQWRRFGPKIKKDAIVVLTGDKDSGRNQIVCQEMKVIA